MCGIVPLQKFLVFSCNLIQIDHHRSELLISCPEFDLIPSAEKPGLRILHIRHSGNLDDAIRLDDIIIRPSVVRCGRHYQMYVLSHDGIPELLDSHPDLRIQSQLMHVIYDKEEVGPVPGHHDVPCKVIDFLRNAARVIALTYPIEIRIRKVLHRLIQRTCLSRKRASLQKDDLLIFVKHRRIQPVVEIPTEIYRIMAVPQSLRVRIEKTRFHIPAQLSLEKRPAVRIEKPMLYILLEFSA